ncbi:unnamed protein product [Pleuronectes platessa]|uniref:Uncharacterized protein n=1 Tax=Pleuronectes platessa TaxID=8262 RepID=A0A9N7UGV8_PLEPL|nr:unnamed protein product [Pleuronectes platessa]
MVEQENETAVGLKLAKTLPSRPAPCRARVSDESPSPPRRSVSSFMTHRCISAGVHTIKMTTIHLCYTSITPLYIRCRCHISARLQMEKEGRQRGMCRFAGWTLVVGAGFCLLLGLSFLVSMGDCWWRRQKTINSSSFNLNTRSLPTSSPSQFELKEDAFFYLGDLLLSKLLLHPAAFAHWQSLCVCALANHVLPSVKQVKLESTLHSPAIPGEEGVQKGAQHTALWDTRAQG